MDKYEILFNYYIANDRDIQYRNERYTSYSGEITSIVEENRQMIDWTVLIDNYL